MYTAICRFLTGCCAAFILAACGPTPTAVTDRYDPAKMDLKPTPARLTSVRHTGPFASGASLNMSAELKPLNPEPVKVVQLDTTHKIIEIAPGVKFSAWTIGGNSILPSPFGSTILFCCRTFSAGSTKNGLSWCTSRSSGKQGPGLPDSCGR